MKSLIVANGSSLLKNHDSVVRLCVIINSALAGEQTDKATFGFYNRNGKYIECILSTYGKENTDGIVDGVFCFIHVPSQELQHVLHVKASLGANDLKTDYRCATGQHDLMGVRLTRHNVPCGPCRHGFVPGRRPRHGLLGRFSCRAGPLHRQRERGGGQAAVVAKAVDDATSPSPTSQHLDLARSTEDER